MHHPDTRDQMEHLGAAAPDPGPTADRGWLALVCPRCVEEATITVGLDDLCHFTCASCGDDFSLADVEAIIAAWTPVLAWLRQAPVKE
jgi:hypothetical protein